MSRFRVLNADPADRSDWISAWAATGREPYAHPSYVKLFAVDGSSAHCATMRSGASLAMLPFLLRPVSVGDWTPASGATDAISPYGYGGPYGTPGTVFFELWEAVLDWLRQHGVVSFFGRLALGVPAVHTVPSPAVVSSNTENIVVDLTRSADQQWHIYEHKVRKNVNAAQRAGLTVEVRKTHTDIAEFVRLYHSTMNRRGASRQYYFDEDFFQRIQIELPENQIVAEVRDIAHKLVSAELVLTSDRYCYSFLGGTASEAFSMRPNDLLKHTVIDFGRRSGLQGYVLGGGLSADDGLFKYKRGFDPTGATPFHRLTVVCNNSAYHDLVDQRLSAVSARGLGALDSTFFPAYRAPSVAAR